MAVTILERPKGYILSSTAVDCIITDIGGFAFFAALNHGMSTGDIIYVTTFIEDYNGFVEVEVTSVSTFFIRSLATGSRIDFIQGLDADQGDFAQFYKSVLTHGWVCAHLPVTYRITNDRWPVNSVDTAQTITTLTNDLGYVNVSSSGALGTFEDLSFVKISNANNSDYNGVYQILDKLSTTNITLNVANGTFTNAGLIGATIQLYYGNYNVVVRVYAGINASHEWTAQKPYELAATLELIPESDNTVFFSINEILKAYIKSENNLLLGTLPNNIDAWANFYISTAEAYDTSNGYAITTLESSFTSDQSTFEGTAVNAKLVFKNIYSGSLSEYLMTNNTAKFLTLFSIPVLFSCGSNTPNCYSDISFLNPYNGIPLLLRQQYTSSTGGSLTTDIDLGTPDLGVIRAELEPDCNYNEVSISVIQTNSIEDLDGFINGSAGTSNWVTGIAAPTNNLGAGVTTKDLQGDIVLMSGLTYTINYSITRAGGSGFPIGTIVFRTTAGGTDIATSGSIALPAGTTVGSFSITPSAQINFVILSITNPGGGTKDFTVNSLTSSDLRISETKEFRIDCGCAMQEIRLTWLNNLGGFEYWAFTGETDHTIDITAAGETKKNIFPEWPNSYGEFAHTIRKQTFRESAKREFVFSQFLTQDEADAIAYIKSSPLVQIINSRTDRRTVIVDTDSFSKYKDGDKTYTISFNILYTDDIPSQRV